MNSRKLIIVHQSLLLAGIATYLIDPENVVWRLIKRDANAKLLEHAFFGAAAVLIGLGSLIGTRQSWRAREDMDISTYHPWGRLLQTIGISTLLPLSGCILFITGDVSCLLHPWTSRRTKNLKTAILQQSGGWCAFLSMAVFALVLDDRLAEILFGGTAVLTIIVHWKV